jgi:hypothetical protein
MANQRGTFAKRQREADLKEKARAKQARRMAKRGEVRTTKGPEMGEAVVLDEPFHVGADAGAGADTDADTDTDTDTDASDEVAPAVAPPGAAAPVAPGAAGSADRSGRRG